jgi:hypothetical protein
MGTPIGYGEGQQPEAQLTAIADIGISQHWIVTPTGSFPIRGSVWTVTDMSHYQERMSPAGIVLCIFFVWACFLGLLFLLMKEQTYSGYIQVTVQGNGFHYSTMVPVNHQGVAQSVTQAVNYARSLAAAA